MGCHIFGNKVFFCHNQREGGRCCLGIQTHYRARVKDPSFPLKLDNPQRWQIKALTNGLDLLHICGLSKIQKQWCMFEEVHAPSNIGLCAHGANRFNHWISHCNPSIFCGEIAMKLGVVFF
jgi:hypothetical protein